MANKCPLCGSTLSDTHYHRVLKLQQRKEKVQKGELARARKLAEAERARAEAASKREKATRAKAKADVEIAKKEAAAKEKKKSAIRDKRLVARIKKLEEEKRMLQKHTSPQELGLADESVLVKKLRSVFPG